MKFHLKISKRLFAYTLGASLAIGGTMHQALTNTSGPNAGSTGAPSENDCSSCHSSGSGSHSFSFSNGRGSTDYLPDSTYSITVTFSKSGVSKYGFQTTVLTSSTAKMAGSFTLTNTTTTQTSTKTFGTDTRTYVMHTSSGTGGSGGVTWRFNWTAPSTNVGDVVFYFGLNASNSNNSSSGDEVYTKTITLTPSSKLPVASFTNSPSSPCAGDSVAFSGSSTNSATGYSWKFAGGTPSISSVQNPKVVFKSFGTFKVSLTTSNAFGKSMEVSKNVTVLLRPVDSFSANKLSLCPGDSALLEAPTGNSFLWSTGQTTKIIYVKTAGTYNVLVRNFNGCETLTKSRTIKVRSKPSFSISRTASSDTLCAGDTLLVQSSLKTSLVYYVGNAAIVSNTKGELRLGGTSLPFGRLRIRARFGDRNDTCASDTSNTLRPFVVENPAKPVVTCDSTGKTALRIKWATSNPNDRFEVSTDSGKTFVKPNGANGLTHTVSGLKPETALRFQVRKLSASRLCKPSEIGTVTCTTASLGCMLVSYKLAYDSLVCAGENVTLRFRDISTKRFSIRFTDRTPSNDTVRTILITRDTVMSFRIVDSTQASTCPATEASIRFKVKARPTATLRQSPEISCDEKPITFTATGGVEYIWTKNGTVVQTGTKSTYVNAKPAQGDLITVQAVNSDGCKSSIIRREVKVGLSPESSLETKDNGNGTYTFTDASKGGTGRLLVINGDSTRDKSITKKFDSSGTYKVTLITFGTNGCNDTIANNLTIKLGINDISCNGNSSLSASPNPFADLLQVSIISPNAGSGIVRLRNISGTEVYSANVSTNGGKLLHTINTSQLPSGVYFLEYTSGGITLRAKVLKAGNR